MKVGETREFGMTAHECSRFLSKTIGDRERLPDGDYSASILVTLVAGRPEFFTLNLTLKSLDAPKPEAPPDA